MPHYRLRQRILGLPPAVLRALVCTSERTTEDMLRGWLEEEQLEVDSPEMGTAVRWTKVHRYRILSAAVEELISLREQNMVRDQGVDEAVRHINSVYRKCQETAAASLSVSPLQEDDSTKENSSIST